MPHPKAHREGLDQDPFWYKTGVIYEVHVRAFHDSDGDGTGDFRGLTAKLDYIQDLGVTAIWLLPFYPSPLKDDGYDIADYYSVHPMYGTLADFRMFLREAHRRGLRVITELVLNHTSDQHPWFRRSRSAPPGSRWREFYVWSDTPAKYQDTRIIFKDVESSNWTWDEKAGAYYWHRFFSFQPDLNWANPEIHDAIRRVLDFWLDLGVDGLRLDAVPYLYEREGTSCENLPETHLALKRLREHVDEKYGDRMLLAEANQWPEDAVAYFGQGRGDECHMAFHFPLMPRLFMALRMEDRLPIVDILEQTPPIPETAQWALFLRNHDELTLEMVTDEERDYMYRMYAQTHQARLNLGIRRRLAPLLGNDRKSIELLNAILFSLPGTPVLYYGDEIGLGENIYLGDRNGVRTPMQWSPDKNAGFSRANPQSLYLPIILSPEYHYEANNVEVQLANPHSLLWWMRRLLALRKHWRALGEGKCEFLQPENRRILSYVLRYRDETILVVANLSRFAQPVELDLTAFTGCVPVELFGHMEFPSVADKPYRLALGPHGFYWFSLEIKPATTSATPRDESLPSTPHLAVEGSWHALFDEDEETELERILPDYLRSRSWFAGAGRAIKSVTLRECLRLNLKEDGNLYLTIVQVDYLQGDADTYLLPLAFAPGVDTGQAGGEVAGTPVARLSAVHGKEQGTLYDATAGLALFQALFQLVRHRRLLRGRLGQLMPIRMPIFRQILDQPGTTDVAGRILRENVSVVNGDKFIVKLVRRLEEGVNPEWEVGRFLTEKGFGHSPPMAGALQYTVADDTPATLVTVAGYIHGALTAYEYTLDALGRFYDRAAARVAQGGPVPALHPGTVKFLEPEIPSVASEEVGTFLESARVLGVRLAELHLTLASDVNLPDFAPEPFTLVYQRSLLQSLRNVALENLRLLRRQLKTVTPDFLPSAQRVAELENVLLQRFRDALDHPWTGKRIRIHGDCHLGRILWTGKDFIWFDFGGDPATPMSERRIKRSPLRDVAGMVRSFDFAAHAGLHQHGVRGGMASEHLHRLESWAHLWYRGVSEVFLKAYFRQLGHSELVPNDETELRIMLRMFLLQQTLVDLGRALERRPERLGVSLQAILRLVGEPLPPRGAAEGVDLLGAVETKKHGAKGGDVA